MAHYLVPRNISLGSGCVSCSTTPPPCGCSSSETCVLIDTSCSTCSYYECISNSSGSSSSGSGGVSAGAVAGAVIASVIVLALVAGAFWFYRRRLRQRREAAATIESKPDVPARAEDVLNRPDPNEKPFPPEPEPQSVTIYSGTSDAVINLDPESRGASSGALASVGHSRRESAQSNPFGDNHSIQTTSTGTQSNVIPIALVPPASIASPAQHSNVLSTQATDGSVSSAGPTRPARAPDLDLGMDRLSVARDALAAKTADGQSQRSGVSGAGNRASYLSTGSFASDLLSEAPVIVTPTRGLVKQQVLGVVKAEVIRAPPGGSPTKSDDGLRPLTVNRPPVRSPLAASSFGPADVVHEVNEDDAYRADPFGDEHSPQLSGQTSPAPSASTFGRDAVSSRVSHAATSGSDEDSPSNGNRLSTVTQAASVIGSVIGAEIGGATRVHLGFDQLRAYPTAPPHTASSGVLGTPRSPYRMTSAKLINTPPSGPASGALEQQQQRALQEIDPGQNRRMSFSSVVSSTSTRADSILESFPFVPPSPISNRPIRTPPRSPLAMQSFGNNNNNSTKQTPVTSPGREPPPRESTGGSPTALPPPPRPINRKALGMSVASQSSTMSNGLSSFPFQIDTGNSGESSASTSSVAGRQRASLDTLALTSDLASYPLNFERNGSPPPLPHP